LAVFLRALELATGRSLARGLVNRHALGLVLAGAFFFAAFRRCQLRYGMAGQGSATPSHFRGYWVFTAGDCGEAFSYATSSVRLDSNTPSLPCVSNVSVIAQWVSADIVNTFSTGNALNCST